MSNFKVKFVALCLFAISWFFGYETLRGRRARRYPGQSTQTYLMQIVYISGWLSIIIAIIGSIVYDILKR